MYRFEIISVSREEKLLPCSPECDKSCYFTPSNLLPKSVVNMRHLTREQRYGISFMLQEGKSRKGKKYNKRGNLIHTITADNGKEFAKHQEIAKELDISFYFCKPYHSWERGANENSPQKRLGYLTPNEKFNLLLTNQNSGCICKLNSPKQKYRLTAKGLGILNSLNKTKKI